MDGDNKKHSKEVMRTLLSAGSANLGLGEEKGERRTTDRCLVIALLLALAELFALMLQDFGAPGWLIYLEILTCVLIGTRI